MCESLCVCGGVIAEVQEGAAELQKWRGVTVEMGKGS